ncbi:MAG: hypothetical protein JRI23_35070 [Deltaproteobacteria bacterium]|jgi:hypothetical protein|nr:hypothetical protein [Deltaproteobacteria bacterium]MBW2537530.1 hypothetical protein [Deltaproteobacteria bacterium]
MNTLRQKLQRSRTAWDRQTGVLLGNWHRAGTDFVSAAGEASTNFGRFVTRESKEWRQYVEATARQTPVTWSPAKVHDVERELLLQISRLLDALQGTVHERLRQLTAADGDESPLEGYDELSAREVVAQAAEWSPEQCAAARRYESSHKQRTTILRALDQRLAN